jgi:hypothetical protein
MFAKIRKWNIWKVKYLLLDFFAILWYNIIRK